MSLWKKFTGEATFEEAERRYAALKKRVASKYQEYKKNYEHYSSEIETYVNSINDSKVKIKTELFPKMAQMMRRIKEYHVNQTFDLTKFEEPELSPIEIRSQQELYKIDFNKHRFRSNFLAVVTLGVLTRKKARETLEAVKEEEIRVEYDIAQYSAQIIKLKTIVSLLRQIDKYFLDLTEIYEVLLERLDSSVKLLYINIVSITKKIVGDAMSIEALPKVCQKEIMAIVTCSLILKHLVETKVTVSDNSEAQIVSYEKELNIQKYEIQKIYNAA